MADSFSQSVFKESFRRVFARHPDSANAFDKGELVMGLAGTLEIVASPEIKIKGAIGPLCTLNKKGPSVSEMELGQGGTWAWRLGAMDQTSTVAVYFDVSCCASDSFPPSSAAPFPNDEIGFTLYFIRARQMSTRRGGVGKTLLPCERGDHT